MKHTYDFTPDRRTKRAHDPEVRRFAHTSVTAPSSRGLAAYRNSKSGSDKLESNKGSQSGSSAFLAHMHFQPLS